MNPEQRAAWEKRAVVNANIALLSDMLNNGAGEADLREAHTAVGRSLQDFMAAREALPKLDQKAA